MELVQDGHADMVSPYWTVSGFYENKARSETFEVGCTVLGLESIFFTKGKTVSQILVKEVAKPLNTAAIAIPAVLAVIGIAFALNLVHREKTGNPMFTPLNTVEDPTNNL